MHDLPTNHVPRSLLTKEGQPLRLVTRDTIKAWRAHNTEYTCIYERVGGQGVPVAGWRCLYRRDDNEGPPFLLVAANETRHVVSVTVIETWADLVAHHGEFGDGTPLSMDG